MIFMGHCYVAKRGHTRSNAQKKKKKCLLLLCGSLKSSSSCTAGARSAETQGANSGYLFLAGSSPLVMKSQQGQFGITDSKDLEYILAFTSHEFNLQSFHETLFGERTKTKQYKKRTTI